MKHETNRHHIVPRSKWWSDINNNILIMDIRRHNALHMLFDNATPIEQIDKILKLSTTALTEEVKSDIIKILNINDLEYFYNKGIIK